MTHDDRLNALADELPPAPKPGGVYRPVVVVGDMAYVSGHGPLKPDKTLITGKVGADLTEEQGKAAARTVGLCILATLKQHFGTLNRIERLVKSLGMVNATPEFGTHPAVINGYSELMVEVFGEEAGVGARSAVGMGSLPGNISVEIEAIFQLKPE
jgi:enamine deaminase RidA (YjgF/YER057c/UK114 family)